MEILKNKFWAKINSTKQSETFVHRQAKKRVHLSFSLNKREVF